MFTCFEAIKKYYKVLSCLSATRYNKMNTGWPLSSHSEIPWHFPDNVRHSCPC